MTTQQDIITAAKSHRWAITEQHLGHDATEQDARRVIRALQRDGWDVEYGEQSRGDSLLREMRGGSAEDAAMAQQIGDAFSDACMAVL